MNSHFRFLGWTTGKNSIKKIRNGLKDITKTRPTPTSHNELVSTTEERERSTQLSLSVQKFECNLHQFLGRNLWVTTFPIPFCLFWARQDPSQPAPFSPWNTKHNSAHLQLWDWDLQKLSQDHCLTDWLGVWFLLRILWSINDLVLKIKINKTQCFQKHAKAQP